MNEVNDAIKQAIKEALQKAIDKKEMTQADLAKLLNVTSSAVSKWFCCKSIPEPETFVAIKEVLGVDLYEILQKKGLRNKKNMKKEQTELKDLNTFDKAVAESKMILEESGADSYSHATYVLLGWIITTAIGLTYHEYINDKRDDHEYYYEDIYFHLNEYFEENDRYGNELERSFFEMGGDLFESFGDDKLPNHDYGHDVIDLWYKIKQGLGDNSDSSLASEFRVALTDIISRNSGY